MRFLVGTPTAIRSSGVGDEPGGETVEDPALLIVGSIRGSLRGTTGSRYRDGVAVEVAGFLQRVAVPVVDVRLTQARRTGVVDTPRLAGAELKVEGVEVFAQLLGATDADDGDDAGERASRAFDQP